jgi:hypothetical protein
LLTAAEKKPPSTFRSVKSDRNLLPMSASVQNVQIGRVWRCGKCLFVYSLFLGTVGC